MHHHVAELFLLNHHCKKRWVPNQSSSSSWGVARSSSFPRVLRSILLCFLPLQYPSGRHGWLQSLPMEEGEGPSLLSTLLVSLSPESTTNSFRYPAFTNCPIWSFNTRHCSVVCPLSLWYVQYKFWFLLDGSPPILFGHMKYGSFFIRSMILCTGSLNVVFTSPSCNFGSCILNSFQGLGWNPLAAVDDSLTPHKLPYILGRLPHQWLPQFGVLG